MTADTHPVPTHRRFAPDPVLLARAVHEQPPATGIPTAPESVAFVSERQRRGHEVVRDAVPAILRRPHRPVGAKPVADSLERDVHGTPPDRGVEIGIVGKRTDRVTERTQPFELGLGRWAPGVGDGVRRQELDGPLGCIEMVMWWFAVPSASAVMGARPVEAVSQPKGRVRPKLPCNGVHRR